MKILVVHNRYRFRGGEEAVVDATAGLLEKKGHQVSIVTRDSSTVGTNTLGKLKAFASGIYSLSAYQSIKSLIHTERPDIVHVHNLYPLFSPSILAALRAAHVPVVMTCHNYRLFCPTGTLLNRNRTCNQCRGGREYRCILNGCRENPFESLAYALRSIVARKLGLFRRSVTLFIALSQFAKNQLHENAELEEERLVVLPNMVPIRNKAVDPVMGLYVAFAGRVSNEKGIDTLLAAAAHIPDLPVLVAGRGPEMEKLAARAPKNVKFLGFIAPTEMTSFYERARFLVMPSILPEMCPLVILEAMSHGLPVIASKIGSLPEFVQDGVSGLLFEPGNSEDLAIKMKLLWHDPDLCRRMGDAGRERVSHEYSEDVYYQLLIGVYERTIEMCKEGR